MSSEIDIELLISAVEARPCLWDKSSEDYKDRNKTNMGWKEVCKTLKEDYSDLSDKEKTTYGRTILKRWNNIRDSFRKYLKQLKTQASGDGASSKKKYVYYEQLRFLEKIFEERPTSDTLPPELPEAAVNVDDTDNSQCSSTLTIRQSNKKKRQPDEVEKKILAILEKTESHHLSFYKGILPTIEDFNEEETIDFQMGVLELIRNIKKKRSATRSSSMTNLPSSSSMMQYRQEGNQPFHKDIPQQTFYHTPAFPYSHPQSFQKFSHHQNTSQPLGLLCQVAQETQSPASSSVNSPSDSQYSDIDFTSL